MKQDITAKERAGLAIVLIIVFSVGVFCGGYDTEHIRNEYVGDIECIPIEVFDGKPMGDFLRTYNNGCMINYANNDDFVGCVCCNGEERILSINETFCAACTGMTYN